MSQKVVFTATQGDQTADGWTIHTTSYEFAYPATYHARIDGRWAVTKVWTHEFRQRPRSVVWRHRSWNPADTIELI